MRKKSLEGTQKCKYCHAIVLGSSYKLKYHLYLHHKAVKARFKCEICGKEYFRRDQYKIHMYIHTGKQTSDVPIFICDYCNRGFKKKRSLIYHLKVHSDSFYKYQYTCMACGVNYCEERLLKYHIRRAHFNLQQDEVEAKNKKINETWVEPVKETDVFVEMTKVNNNIITIKKCDKNKTEKVKAAKSLTKYLSPDCLSKDESQYSKAICNYCNKEMLKKSLRPHIRERHLKLKRFSCDKCKMGFCRHYQLVNHICGKTRQRKVKKK